MNDLSNTVDHRGAGSASNDVQSLKRSLGTAKLVVFVIAAVAPLAAVVGVLPVALVFGSGAALPLAFVLATVVVGLFSVGYSAMSREVVVGGAFYTYIAKGLGPVAGFAAAAVAVMSYLTFVPGGISYFGFVVHTLFADLAGVDIHWIWFSAVAALAIALLGYRKLEVSSGLVMAVILLEFVLLLIFDAGVIHQHGPATFPAEALNVSALWEGAPGVSLLLAFTCYFGIESAALYSEEARSPEKSVSRATYTAVALIGVFYFLTAWITVGAIGPANVRAIPPEQVGLIYFNLSDKYLGRVFTHVIQVAVATSMFATVVSIHNVAARYMFVLARQGCLPRGLSRVHPVHRSPSAASLVVTVVSVVVVALAAMLAIHPMVGLGTVALGLAAVGVMGMQAMTSAAVVAYFWRRPDRSPWRHVVAPVLSLFGLVLALWISVENFEYLSGNSNPMVNRIPFALVLALCGGALYAVWLRRTRPAQFASLAFD